MFIFQPYLDRYRRESWRAPVFRDMILDDVRGLGSGLTLLDIGCGRGFDGDMPLQESIAAVAGRYIGIEPDSAVEVGPYFTETHRCFLEDAPLPPASVDIAFAVMVLEHLPAPARFWRKLWHVLKEGGVFWGFTVDARHWFATVSRALDCSGVKDYYLNHMLGARGLARYENYPVYYRSNTPWRARRHASSFREVNCISLSKGCYDLWSYTPPLLRPALRRVETWLGRRATSGGRGAAGVHFAIRARK
jgi:SAM-dependent methyltransferase